MKINLDFIKSLDFKKEDKKKLALIVLITLTLFMLYINVLFRPIVAILKEMNPKLRSLKNDTEMVKDWLREQDLLEAQLKALQARIGRYKSALSVEEELSSLLEELSNMALASNVKIIGIKPEKVVISEDKTRKKPFEEIPISINARCGYHQLGRFISELENASRLFIVRNLEIEGDVQTPRNHKVSLTVSTFLISED